MAIHTFDEVFERLVTTIGTGQLVGVMFAAGRVSGYVDFIEDGVVALTLEWDGHPTIEIPLTAITAVAYVTPATATGNRWERL